MVKPYSLVSGQLVSCPRKNDPTAELGKDDEKEARDQKKDRCRPRDVRPACLHCRTGSTDAESQRHCRLNIQMAVPDLIPNGKRSYCCCSAVADALATQSADHDVKQTASQEVTTNGISPLPDLVSHLAANENAQPKRRKKFRLNFPQVRKSLFRYINQLFSMRYLMSNQLLFRLLLASHGRN